MFEPFDTEKFDFDSWQALAKNDPAAFEAKRKALLEETIAQCPEHLQDRLRGLQFHIDGQRQLAKNPIDAMQKLYSLMMNKVYGEEGLLDALESLTQNKPQKKEKKKESAKIISFSEEAESC